MLLTICDRRDQIPCYRRKRGAGQRCLSCRSSACSFRSARQVSPPPASVLGVIGRLEALSGTEADAGRKEVLDKCVADLRAS